MSAVRHIGEGLLPVPEHWHDNTINIFTAKPAGSPGLSVTANRDRLPYGVAFEAYAEEQVGKLRARLADFRLLDARDAPVGGRPGRLYEFTWRAEDGAAVHQILLSLCDGARLLNLAASQNGVMDDAARAEMRAVLTGFRFADAGAWGG